MEDDDEEHQPGDFLPVGQPWQLQPPRAVPPYTKVGKCDMMIYSDGSAYAGDWVLGMRSGWGVYNSADGSQYLGVSSSLPWLMSEARPLSDSICIKRPSTSLQEWLTDRFEGLGVYKYPSGNRFEGEFKADQRHGRGLYLWRNTVWKYEFSPHCSCTCERRGGGVGHHTQGGPKFVISCMPICHSGRIAPFTWPCGRRDGTSGSAVSAALTFSDVTPFLYVITCRMRPSAPLAERAARCCAPRW